MKILQIAAHYPPSLGGIQYFTQSLSRSLAQKGHSVHVLTINTDGAAVSETTPEGVMVRRCKLTHSFYRALISKEHARRLIRADSFDVYHIHIPFPFGLEIAAIASKKNKIPLVATYHGQGFQGSLFYISTVGSYSLMSKVVSLRAVDATIFLTPSYAASVWLPESVRRRVRIVRTGAETDRFSFQGQGSEIRKRHDLPKDSPLILFVGHLGLSNRYKGVDYLIRALGLVNSALPDVRLMVVGGGGLLDELTELVKSLGLEDSVVFTGAIDNNYLPNYYAAADLLALPSISGPENSPVVVFEAMASAKPVVASDLPGVCDIVRDGQTGILVPPRDVETLARALIKVLEDPGFRVRAGCKARKIVESFSWDHCAEEMEKVYSELIE